MTPALPADFPTVEGVTITKSEEAGPSQVADGYYEGSLEDAYEAFKTAIRDAGYSVIFDEIEEEDSEVAYSGGDENTSGFVALRENCARRAGGSPSTSRTGRSEPSPPGPGLRAGGGRGLRSRCDRVRPRLPVDGIVYFAFGDLVGLAVFAALLVAAGTGPVSQTNVGALRYLAALVVGALVCIVASAGRLLARGAPTSGSGVGRGLDRRHDRDRVRSAGGDRGLLHRPRLVFPDRFRSRTSATAASSASAAPPSRCAPFSSLRSASPWPRCRCRASPLEARPRPARSNRTWRERP